MRLHYYYRLLGFLVVFVLAMSTNYLLERRGKCSDSPLQNPQAVEGAAVAAAACAEVTADTQGVVLLEGPKIEPIKISAGQYPQSLKAEDLYKASIPAVKAILMSQNKFFIEHQKYADNLAQLNLALAPSVQAEAERSGSIQSDFNIIVNAEYADTVHYSFPISPEENYTLRFYNNGKVSCMSKEAIAGNTCQILARGHHPDICLPDAVKCPTMPPNPQAPIIRSITADYTEYALPDNFLQKF